MLKELFTELVLNMKTGLVINNESINDMEWLWFRIANNRDFSNVNFGFELGKKGPTALAAHEKRTKTLTTSR
jgi:hypothetical protein